LQADRENEAETNPSEIRPFSRALGGRKVRKKRKQEMTSIITPPIGDN
jgi:hypothetical protein